MFDVRLPARRAPFTLREINEYRHQQERIEEMLRATGNSARNSLGATRVRFLQDLYPLQAEQRGLANAARVRADAALAIIVDRLVALMNPGMRDLAREHAQVEDVLRLYEDAQRDFGTLGEALRVNAGMLQTARASQVSSQRELDAIIAAGSSATLATLPAVEARLAAWERQESDSANVLLLESTAAMSGGANVLGRFEELIALREAFLAAHGMVRPRVPQDAARYLGNIAAYADMRRRDVDGAARGVRAGIRERGEALVQIATDQATRDTFAQTRLLEASQDFLDAVNHRVERLLALPPMTTRLRAPLLADKYDETAAILQLQPLCTAQALATFSWRQTGCNALSVSFPRAQNYLDRTIPSLLRANVATLRRAGADAAALQTIDAYLGANNVRGAAVASDALLRSVDTAPFQGASPTAAVASTMAVGSPSEPSRRIGFQQMSGVDDGPPDHEFPDDAGPGTYAPFNCTSDDVRVVRLCRAREALSLLAVEALRNKAFEDSLLALQRDLAGIVGPGTDADAFAAAIQTYSLAPSDYDLLVGVVRDMNRTGADLRAQIGDLVAKANATAGGLPQLPTAAAASVGLDLTDASLFVPVPLVTSGVAIPAVATSSSYDDGGAFYAGYADRIIAKLAGSIGNGAVRDRALFIGTVQSWHQNSSMLSASVAPRAATAPLEKAAFDAAEARIAAVVYQYYAADDWFSDTSVSPATRNAVDGPLAKKLGAESRALKDVLNTWTNARTADQTLVDDTLAALGAAVGSASFDTADADTRVALAGAAGGAAALAAHDGAPRPTGTFSDLCSALTSRAGCSGSGASLDLGEAVGIGLGVRIASSETWRSMGGASLVADRLGAIVDGTSDLTVMQRQALVARVGGGALMKLAGASGADIATIADELGDERVRILGASLPLASLRTLRDLGFMGAGLPGADSASGAKTLPALAGRTAADIRTLVTSAGFVKSSATGADEEIWYHPTDGSLVRMAPHGTDLVPGRAVVVREISSAPGRWTPDVTLSVLADRDAAVVPASPDDARTRLADWFRQSSVAGRAPSIDEARELQAYWLLATHVAYTP